MKGIQSKNPITLQSYRIENLQSPCSKENCPYQKSLQLVEEALMRRNSGKVKKVNLKTKMSLEWNCYTEGISRNFQCAAKWIVGVLVENYGEKIELVEGPQ